MVIAGCCRSAAHLQVSNSALRGLADVVVRFLKIPNERVPAAEPFIMGDRTDLSYLSPVSCFISQYSYVVQILA